MVLWLDAAVHMAHCINSGNKDSHQESTSRLDFFNACIGHRTYRNRRWRREHAIIEIECVAKLSALAKYADALTHSECVGEFANFKL